jgi:hypothetical protein
VSELYKSIKALLGGECLERFKASGFELIEEDARRVDIRGLNWPTDLTVWTGPTVNAWFCGVLW